MVEALEAEQALQPPATPLLCSIAIRSHTLQGRASPGVWSGGPGLQQSPGRPHKFVLQCETWKVNTPESYITWKESGSVHYKVESVLSQEYVMGRRLSREKGGGELRLSPDSGDGSCKGPEVPATGPWA